MKRWRRRARIIRHAAKKRRKAIKRILVKAARRAIGGDRIA